MDQPFAFARVQAFNSYLCSTVHVAHAHRMRGYRWADEPAALEAMKKEVPVSVGECFDLIERTMFKGPWVMGETYSYPGRTQSPICTFSSGGTNVLQG
jgi:glutathione S-transferase